MLEDINNTTLFCDYYRQWIDVYKKGAIRDATMSKYLMTQKWVVRLAPKLKVSELTRTVYQQLLNDYAKEHERQTTLDFHHQLKGAILDAVDEGLIARDPTRKAIIKGKPPRVKKIKYLTFQGTQIEAIYLPKSIESPNALEAMLNLKTITVAKDNPYYTAVNGVLFTKDKKKLVRYPARGLRTYTILTV